MTSNFFIDTLFNRAPTATITAHFSDGNFATYSAEMRDLLASDPATVCITDGTTGEIIYSK